MSDLKELLSLIQEHSQSGNRRELSRTLRLLLQDRREYYRQSIRDSLMEKFSEALYKALLLELDNEEEESIEIAELAYLTLGTALNDGNSFPELYKGRLLLLHYFSDFFTDSIIEVFLARFKKENRLQARSLAIECLEKMQLSDMIYLEEHEADFINGDEQLTDACNAIETATDLSEEERADAILLHKVLHAYLKTKYKRDCLTSLDSL
ncbi:MAG: hypothetical protein K2L23_02240, partial [Odoribacter sp.]|nr:hypothetical protein [Odoribacter sp.]